ncbi:MAG: NAD-dependent epimerase/dehydratase family protein, partial [Planctomycetota bacterium]|nr:NAD-dependent epimerase/dehydratase family protein [Planctomycetota bacterium]
MLNWAVTGGSGWLGGHVLSASAAASGADAERNTIAWGRRRPVAPCDLWMPVDLLDARSIADAIAHAPPDVVIHAAGRTPPGSADDL